MLQCIIYKALLQESSSLFESNRNITDTKISEDHAAPGFSSCQNKWKSRQVSSTLDVITFNAIFQNRHHSQITMYAVVSLQEISNMKYFKYTKFDFIKRYPQGKEFTRNKRYYKIDFGCKGKCCERNPQ